MTDFLSARSQITRPPQWPSIAPPLTSVELIERATKISEELGYFVPGKMIESLVVEPEYPDS